MTDSAEAASPSYEEVVGTQILSAPNRLLTADEIDMLWSLVERIEAAWFSDNLSISPVCNSIIHFDDANAI